MMWSRCWVTVAVPWLLRTWQRDKASERVSWASSQETLITCQQPWSTYRERLIRATSTYKSGSEAWFKMTPADCFTYDQRFYAQQKSTATVTVIKTLRYNYRYRAGVQIVAWQQQFMTGKVGRVEALIINRTSNSTVVLLLLLLLQCY